MSLLAGADALVFEPTGACDLVHKLSVELGEFFAEDFGLGTALLRLVQPRTNFLLDPSLTFLIGVL